MRQQLIADANNHFGYASALVIDEVPAKKGRCRLAWPASGTGAWAKPTIVRSASSLPWYEIESLHWSKARLYIPEEWFSDPARCRKPASQGSEFCTKGMALNMIHRLRRRGRFSHVVFDAGYGHLP